MKSDIPGMKRCSKCYKEYSATFANFSPHKQHADGLASRCKHCKRLQIRKYREKKGARMKPGPKHKPFRLFSDEELNTIKKIPDADREKHNITW
jgi:hypothetical protein